MSYERVQFNRGSLMSGLGLSRPPAAFCFGILTVMKG